MVTGAARTPGLPLVVLCGPTAAGKTALALDLAGRLPFEAISADSRQVFRGMDIGTAKPTLSERQRLPHHLLDVADPGESFSAADFVRLARPVVAALAAAGKRPLLVGGTGLYIRALTEGLLDAPAADPFLREALRKVEAEEGEGTLHRRLCDRDPEAAARIHPRNLVRIIRALEVLELSGQRISEMQRAHAFGERPFRLLKIGVMPAREELMRRIDLRAERMLAEGLLEEVRGLLAQGYGAQSKAMRTIGYREMAQHLGGELSLDEALARIKTETRRYAKRQLTWFRADPSIIWVDSSEESARILASIERFYAA
jgi:tRNA dimethylallyltransferase